MSSDAHCHCRKIAEEQQRTKIYWETGILVFAQSFGFAQSLLQRSSRPARSCFLAYLYVFSYGRILRKINFDFFDILMKMLLWQRPHLALGGGGGVSNEEQPQIIWARVSSSFLRENDLRSIHTFAKSSRLEVLILKFGILCSHSVLQDSTAVQGALKNEF